MSPARRATAEVDETTDTSDDTVDAQHDAAEPADEAWAESLRDVMRSVIASLPDRATLGELVDATRTNPAIAPVLDIFTIAELIETAKKKPKPKPTPQVDADGMPPMELDAGPKVIRRRADVPDGDLRVLRALASSGPLKESELVSNTQLTSEQLRIIVRHLRTKGYIHVEGSGAKRRVKITRNGSGFLRKQG
ncbi:MAG: hypothetical protein AAGA54_06070 [Myxococcota bacterium]